MTEMEDRWRELGEFIREQRGQLSLRKVSEMAGISNPYLSQIERGLRKPSAEILRQIAGALHISAETLYVRAGILDEPDGDHDLEASIRRDPYLDEEHKKTLLHIYRSFRSAYLAANGEPDEAGPADGPTAEPEDVPTGGDRALDVPGGHAAASTAGELDGGSAAPRDRLGSTDDGEHDAPAGA